MIRLLWGLPMIPATAMVVACGGASSARPQPPAPQPIRAAPFASVVALEPVELAVPMVFRRSGRMIEAKHVVVMYLRVTEVERFLPRGIETATVVLEDSPAISLYPPLRPVWALVAPRPGILLREAALWVAPIGGRATERDKGSLLALRRESQRKKPADLVPLSTVPSEAVRSAPAVIRDRSALLSHVLARADSLAKRTR